MELVISYDSTLALQKIGTHGSPTVAVIKPFNGDLLSDSTWSFDNSTIFALSRSGTCLKCMPRSNVYDQTSHISLEVRNQISCIETSRKSLLLLAGSPTGVLTLYNTNRCNIKNTWTAISSWVNCVSFNNESTECIAGHESGDISLSNIYSGQGVQHMCLGVGPKQPSCDSLSANYFNNFLSSGYRDGTIALWDLSKLQVHHSYKHVHQSTVTALSFSPINMDVLASCSLDCTMKLFASSKDKPLFSCSLTSPATCINLAPNGCMVAVGTRTSGCLVYDLRNLSKPLFVVEDTLGRPVYSVRFQSGEEIKHNENEVSVDEHSVNQVKSKALSDVTNTSNTESAKDVPASVLSENGVHSTFKDLDTYNSLTNNSASSQSPCSQTTTHQQQKVKHVSPTPPLRKTLPSQPVSHRFQASSATQTESPPSDSAALTLGEARQLFSQQETLINERLCHMLNEFRSDLIEQLSISERNIQEHYQSLETEIATLREENASLKKIVHFNNLTF